MIFFDKITNSFLFNLFKLARFSYAKKYLLKDSRVPHDLYKMHVPAKHKQGTLSIWVLKQIKHRKKKCQDDLYFWDFGAESWLGNLNHVQGLYEYLSGAFDDFYKYEYQGKTVLDVGGYIGDSARYFCKKGARKVVVYEPVDTNLLCMKHNLKQYQNHVEIHPKAVGNKDGDITIASDHPPGDTGFGYGHGDYIVKVQSQSFTSILTHTEADVAKIDCEGYERYLLDVPNELLRRIPYWIIEVHGEELRKQLQAKFTEAQFKKKKISDAAEKQAVDHYYLVQN